MRISAINLVFLLASFWMVYAPSAPAAEPGRPNILVILADDLACNELGCYGGRNVATPHIDGLAREGMRFNLAFSSSPSCTPTRSSLYSGLYPVRNGAHRNHADCKPGTLSVVQFLSARGYRVGLTGKKDVRPPASFPFEKVAGFEPDCVSDTANYDITAPNGVHDFLTRDAKQPFCLFVCSTLPHVPWTVGDPSHFDPAKVQLPPSFADTPKMRQAFVKYLAEVQALDLQTGDVLTELKRDGLSDSTLVLFCGEQGPQFPRGKWTCYDLGLKTALIARLPGRIKAGTTTDAIVQYEDVTPTLVDLAGGAPPQAADGKPLDGRSFLGVLTGKTTSHRDVAFGIHDNWPEGDPYPIRSVRSERYELILNLDPDRTYTNKFLIGLDKEDYWRSWTQAAQTDPAAREAVNRYLHRPAVELYDTRNDPWEMRNLADDPDLATTRADLELKLQDWMTAQHDTGAAMDIPRPAPASGKR